MMNGLDTDPYRCLSENFNFRNVDVMIDPQVEGIGYSLYPEIIFQIITHPDLLFSLEKNSQLDALPVSCWWGCLSTACAIASRMTSLG